MEHLCRRLAVEEEEVMSAHQGPIYGERIDSQLAAALIYPFRHAFPAADRMEGKLTPDELEGDALADLVPPETMARAARDALRFPGLRDILVVGHPVVTQLHDALDADRDRIPAPDPAIVAKLAIIDGFAIDGPIVAIGGVPLPAGKRQTDYYVVLRWRPLYGPGVLPHLVYCRDPGEVRAEDYAALGIGEDEDPKLIHLVAYDAATVTDEMQVALLSYGTAIHRDNLVALQESHPELYVALWRRDLEAAKVLVRRSRPALPPSNPKSRIRSRALRLLYGTSLMSEFERLFEVIDAVKADGGVTRQSLDAALRSSTSMTGVHMVGDATHEFLAGSIAHVRSIHSTMNDQVTARRTGDPMLERARATHHNARAYSGRVKRTRWIAGAMPAQYFIGIEPAMLAPVALAQMVENMTRREHGYWLRGKRGYDAGGDDARAALTIELGVIITSDICLATARSMLPKDQADKELAGLGLARSDVEWRDAVVPTLIANPILRDEVEKLLGKSQAIGILPGPPINDSDPKRTSQYVRVTERVAALVRLGRPGWTQGFLFEAWLRPDAEWAFLRDCCRYIRYDPKLAARRDAWNAGLARTPRADGTVLTATGIATGLPRQHPLERVQDLFRDLFDRLQVAEMVDVRDNAKQRAWREAVIREVAPLLAAVSPITVDPQLNERWWDDLDPSLRAIATQGAWNT